MFDFSLHSFHFSKWWAAAYVRYEICEKGIQANMFMLVITVDLVLVLVFLAVPLLRVIAIFSYLLSRVSPFPSISFFFHSHISWAQVCVLSCGRMCGLCLYVWKDQTWLAASLFRVFEWWLWMVANQSVCSLWMNTGNSQNEKTLLWEAAHSHHSWVARKCRWWLGQRTGQLSTTLPISGWVGACILTGEGLKHGGQQQKQLLFQILMMEKL